MALLFARASFGRLCLPSIRSTNVVLVGIRTPRALIGWRSLIGGKSTSDVLCPSGGHRRIGSGPTRKLGGGVGNTPLRLTH